MTAEVIHLATRDILDRGSQQELAFRLLAADRRVAANNEPRTDAANVYHTFDPESGLWRPRGQVELECRVDRFDGADVQGAKGPRPLKLKASDAPAVVSIMKRQTWEPGFFRDDLVAFANGFCAHVARGDLYFDRLRADHGARVMLPVAYEPDWTMPADGMLANYLRTTFDDEADRLLAVEILGAALLGLGTRYKKAFFVTDGPDVEGQGGTGKSQFLKMLEGLVPAERVSRIPPQLLADDYHGVGLLGKTLNIVYEAPDTDILREEGVKAIIHGESIRRRPIRQEPIEFTPSALHIFAVNRLPDAPGATGAFWDRWRVLEFSRRFRDTGDAIADLAEKILAAELADLVHLALRGAERLLRNAKYSTSAASADALERWRLHADPVAMFVFEMTEPIESTAPGSWITAARLYDAYRQWASSRGHSPCSMQKFGRRLPSEVEKSRSGGVSRYRLDLRG